MPQNGSFLLRLLYNKVYIFLSEYSISRRVLFVSEIPA